MTNTIEIPDWCSMWDSESDRFGDSGMTRTSFEDKLNEFRQLLISGELYSTIPGKNEETLAMISVYRFGKSRMKREAKEWLEKVMEGVGF